MNKFRSSRLNRLVPLGLLACAAALWLAPAVASATPVTYRFTVSAFSGPLSGTISHGTFAFDSSSITLNGGIGGPDLLTNLDFNWDGTHYDATTANTGYLQFDAAGQLIDFEFGNACNYRPSCGIAYPGPAQWAAYGDPFTPSNGSFQYLADEAFGAGTLEYSAVQSVPEPAALGMFGLGLLLIGGFVGVRRKRVA